MRTQKCAALALALLLALSAWGAAGEEGLSLRDRYEGLMTVGAEAALDDVREEAGREALPRQFHFLSGGEAMTAAAVLDRSSSVKSKDSARARLNFSKPGPLLSFALENQMQAQFGPLVSAGAPRWFFAEKWSSMPNAPLVDRDTMLKRMENLIAGVIESVNAQYPGAVCAWDVADGAREGENLWAQVIGGDYVAQAFAFARQYAAKEQPLFFILPEGGLTAEEEALVRSLKEKGLLDGVKLTLPVDGENSAQPYEDAMKSFAEWNLAVHAVLKSGASGGSLLSRMRLAAAYRSAMALLEKEGAQSVTFASLRGENGLMDEAFRRQPAFFGAVQSGQIPLTGGEEALMAAAENLGFEEEGSVSVYKTLKEHNPVMVQRFGADPWAMVYDGRVYLYMTGDEPMLEADGTPRTNNYSNITTLRVLSSADLVNWQDHGSINAAGRNGAAKWAANSWAPCAACQTIDGQDRFFLYFANSGGGIGVLTADSPTGPFWDPLGKPLISRDTPNCRDVTWLFDPAILVDSDGKAYLYFGGGIPEGRQADPGTARVVRLGEDMVSLDGDPIAFNPPWLFEDSGINKMGDTYVYSYCSNFQVPSGGSEQGFGGGEIVYMTSSSPMGPFSYKGRVLKNPSAYFGVGGNNHHCMFSFQGKWYITYHAATVDQAMGWNAGYRSTFVDELRLDGEGLPALSQGTLAGPAQLCPLNPFQEVNGAVLASLAGAETQLIREEDQKAGAGEMAAVSTAAKGWIGIAGVDFGGGAQAVSLRCAAPSGAKVEILLDSLDSAPLGVVSLPPAEEAGVYTAALDRGFGGVHDVYFRFSQPGVTLLCWQFIQ